MDTAKNKCVWAYQCGEGGCEECCEHYYPLDGSVEEQEYEGILRELMVYSCFGLYAKNMEELEKERYKRFTSPGTQRSGQEA